MEKLEIKEVDSSKFFEIWPTFKEIAESGETYPWPQDVTEEKAKNIWFAEGAKVYNAYINSEFVASRYIIPNKPELGSHICNTGIIINKDFRGKGLGKNMMEFALKKAEELGYKAIQLNLVFSTNTASVKICKEYGFQIIGTIPEAFHYKAEKYIDAYVMYKKL